MKPKRNVRKEFGKAIKSLRLTNRQIVNLTMETYVRACYRDGLSEKDTVSKLRRNAKCLYGIFDEHGIRHSRMV
jgi:hypothetical protein